jgi:TonB family protein
MLDMSDLERDAQETDDRDLQGLFRYWTAPDPPKSLDQRVTAAFRRHQMNRAVAASNPVLLPERDSEVVKMKQCPACNEEFADKFSFCPVDGTPLNGFYGTTEDFSRSEGNVVYSEPETTFSSAPVSPDGFASDTDHGAYVHARAGAANDQEFHLTILQDAGLTHRLMTELRAVALQSQLTWPDFKRDPVGFTRRSASAYGRMTWKSLSNPNVAVGISTAIILVSAAVVFVYVKEHMCDFFPKRCEELLAQKQREDLQLQELIDTNIPAEQEKVDKGTAGMNKGNGGGSKPKQDKPGGGGGGGRQEDKPASFGKLPQASLTVPQVVAPDPHPPTIKNPSLPVPATMVADPALFPADARPINYGEPKSKSTETSSGPGTGNGIGTGTGGGIGSGEGGGYGPGRGGNTGGGDRHDGGGGPGGGGDYSKVFSPREVTQKMRIISKPEPQYTEEARKNQISGTVRVSAVFSSSGQVTNVRVVSGLPYGLAEKAIAAAHQIKFVPATKDGHVVSQYVTIEYNFNLY